MKKQISKIMAVGFFLSLMHLSFARATEDSVGAVPTTGTESTNTPTPEPTPEPTQAPAPIPVLTVVQAPGDVFYKMQNGEIVRSELTLEVPMKGQGDILLKTNTTDFKATKFWTEHKSGRTIFYMTFDNPPGAPENTKAIFKGTYIRGTNVALYYGDIYQIVSSVKQAKEFSQLRPGHHQKEKDLKYIGGFFFKSPITGASH